MTWSSERYDQPARQRVAQVVDLPEPESPTSTHAPPAAGGRHRGTVDQRAPKPRQEYSGRDGQHAVHVGFTGISGLRGRSQHGAAAGEVDVTAGRRSPQDEIPVRHPASHRPNRECRNSRGGLGRGSSLHFNGGPRRRGYARKAPGKPARRKRRCPLLHRDSQRAVAGEGECHVTRRAGLRGAARPDDRLRPRPGPARR